MPTSNSTTHIVKAMKEKGYSQDDTTKALLYRLAHNEALLIGAAPNSKIFKSLLSVAEQAYSLASSEEMEE